MKWLPVLLIGMIIIVFAGSTNAEDKVYVPKKNEELYGTWINTDYKGPQPLPKRIFYPIGIFELLPDKTSTKPDWQGTYRIIDKWSDSEGNAWYKIKLKCCKTGLRPKETYALYKISKNGSVCEEVSSYHGYPKKVDPKIEPGEGRYRIYYRE